MACSVEHCMMPPTIRWYYDGVRDAVVVITTTDIYATTHGSYQQFSWSTSCSCTCGPPRVSIATPRTHSSRDTSTSYRDQFIELSYSDSGAPLSINSYELDLLEETSIAASWISRPSARRVHGPGPCWIHTRSFLEDVIEGGAETKLISCKV